LIFFFSPQYHLLTESDALLCVKPLAPNNTCAASQGELFNFHTMRHMCQPILATLVWPCCSFSLGFSCVCTRVCECVCVCVCRWVGGWVHKKL